MGWHGFVHEVRSVTACRSSGERERPRCYGMPAFHRGPSITSAYDTSSWPEAGRATLPVQALPTQDWAAAGSVDTNLS